MCDMGLYRGKRTDNGEWEYGYYVRIGPVSCQRAYIIPHYASALYAVEVISETVGQYIGETDRNGKKIFEDDVFAYDNKKSRVEFYKAGFFPFSIAGWECTPEPNDGEIIGNIHDNPELMKG